MNITLNFEAPGQNTCTVAADLAFLFGSQSVKLRVQDSSYVDDKGERVQAMTFIAKLAVKGSWEEVIEAADLVSIHYAQDCIAVRKHMDNGNTYSTLIGPRAAAWLPFNPEFFVEY